MRRGKYYQSSGGSLSRSARKAEKVARRSRKRADKKAALRYND